MKVICVRLNSGEEIIGKVVETVSTSDTIDMEIPKGKLTLTTVRGITFQPVGKNQIGIAFIPFAVGNDSANMTFILENCAQTIFAPSREIERGYLEQTSGITLAAATPGISI